MHQWYLDHIDAYRTKARKQRLIQRPLFREVIRQAKQKPCADCGIQYAYWIMQFDHLSDDKKFNVGDTARIYSMRRLKEEIAKCEVVCANCHANRTYYQRNQQDVAQLG